MTSHREFVLESVRKALKGGIGSGPRPDGGYESAESPSSKRQAYRNRIDPTYRGEGEKSKRAEIESVIAEGHSERAAQSKQGDANYKELHDKAAKANDDASKAHSDALKETGNTRHSTLSYRHSVFADHHRRLSE